MISINTQSGVTEKCANGNCDLKRAESHLTVKGEPHYEAIPGKILEPGDTFCPQGRIRAVRVSLPSFRRGNTLSCPVAFLFTGQIRCA